MLHCVLMGAGASVKWNSTLPRWSSPAVCMLPLGDVWMVGVDRCGKRGLQSPTQSLVLRAYRTVAWVYPVARRASWWTVGIVYAVATAAQGAAGGAALIS